MRTHDEAIESMSDVGKWQNANCETCGGPVRWRWTNLRAVADTGDERVAGKEIEHALDAATSKLHADISCLRVSIDDLCEAARVAVRKLPPGDDAANLMLAIAEAEHTARESRME